jgi:hypothetical protein
LTPAPFRVHCADEPRLQPNPLAVIPALPPGQGPVFRSTVHGTVFGERAERLQRVAAGDPLLLIPDPPMEDDPSVWVHLKDGEPLGHLPPEICAWLAPWLYRGGIATATALKIGGADAPSWKRLIVEVHCELPSEA